MTGGRLALLALAALLAVMWLASCAATQASQGATAQRVTAVHVVLEGTSPEMPATFIHPLDRTVDDAGRSQRLYDALLALPVFPSGVMSCPSATGAIYALTFSRDGATVAQALVQADGCQGVSLTNDPSRWTRWAATSPQFWADLAAAVSVPQGALYGAP